ncbi:hypothetical protein SKAU_G00339190 [Synaphobranchus kaupii]|uniref:Uncharacterized protein n=1 Tax=Synaphobranchus kaupii TaxID=118154 RepID=A0A9Q1EMQ3_SYNKA|nr:hypothetical protein SKAU_G00339190 [Synaphobranchus kaupii]
MLGPRQQQGTPSGAGWHVCNDNPAPGRPCQRERERLGGNRRFDPITLSAEHSNLGLPTALQLNTFHSCVPLSESPESALPLPAMVSAGSGDPAGAESEVPFDLIPSHPNSSNAPQPKQLNL